GRIEVAARRGERLPAGWAIDEQGRPATTPEAALKGALHPLGGAEETGGYKGYGLSLTVDLLTAVLAGGRSRAGAAPPFCPPLRPLRPRPQLHRHRPGGGGRPLRVRGAA